MRKHIENPNGRYHSIQFMCDDANMSRKTLMSLAVESGSLIEIAYRTKRIDSEKFYKYMAEKYAVRNEMEDAD